MTGKKLSVLSESRKRTLKHFGAMKMSALPRVATPMISTYHICIFFLSNLIEPTASVFQLFEAGGCPNPSDRSRYKFYLILSHCTYVQVEQLVRAYFVAARNFLFLLSPTRFKWCRPKVNANIT